MSAGPHETYLDHDASAPLLPEARAALLEALDAGPGNASSAHGAGRRLRRILGDARARVAALVGARPEQIVFTSGTSESNALALRGALATLPRAAQRVVTTDAEHEGLLALVAALAADGVEVRRAGVDRGGRFSADDVRALAGESPGVIAVCAAQSVTGALQPVAEVCAESGPHTVLVDAAQTVGRLPVDTARLGCDLLSFSAHKLGGPHGIGALFVRDDDALRLPGAETAQERGRRAGTEAVALAAAFGAAADHAARQSVAAWAAHCRAVLAPLDAHVAEDAGLACLSPADGLPNTRLVHAAGCRGDALLAALDACGIRVSTGTACASGARRPPHVLLAAGFPHDVARECLRVSVGRETTRGAVLALVAALRELVPRVREALGGA